jgi:hypothetical protein
MAPVKTPCDVVAVEMGFLLILDLQKQKTY